MSTAVVGGRVRVAEALAEVLLRELPERLEHTRGVAERATELSVTLPAEQRDLLVAAAWLHDIGYGAEVRVTGFHPLDGADHLDRQGWPRRLSGLVAHHSGAAFLAPLHGLAGELARYPDERSELADALTYADQTVGPHGRRMTLDERMTDMLARHGGHSPNARVHHLRGPHLRAVAARVRPHLADHGIAA
jgi:HD superfamily phosphodiesterase